MTTAAETWNEIYASGRAMRWWPSEDVVRFTARRLKQGSRVLEVGCGNGANTWGLVDAGCEVVAIDASHEAIMLAAQYVSDRRPHPALELHVARLADLRGYAATSRYDAIIDCRVSQHVPWKEHQALYRTYRDLLKPGGWLFLLHLDNLTSDARRNDDLLVAEDAFTWSDIAEGVYPHNGLVCMPPAAALQRMVLDSGFRIDRCEGLPRVSADVVARVTLTASHVAIDARPVP